MASREQEIGQIKYLINKLRYITLAVQILPFVYSFFYILSLVMYLICDESALRILDTLFYVSPIAKETIVNLWFRKWGKAYYSFKGSSSKFFIFDSGIDWNYTMDEYKWGQIAWFAQELLNNQDDHIVLGLHIVCNSGDVFTQNTAPLANNILLMAQAFNAKTTITLNGITYDFTNAYGTVHCALCGHTHYDASAVINGIPVFCTAAARDGIFDLVLIDYGAGKLKSIRIGTGSNRELNLV